jgi:hypothetical protein
MGHGPAFSRYERQARLGAVERAILKQRRSFRAAAKAQIEPDARVSAREKPEQVRQTGFREILCRAERHKPFLPRPGEAEQRMSVRIEDAPGMAGQIPDRLG